MDLLLKLSLQICKVFLSEQLLLSKVDFEAAVGLQIKAAGKMKVGYWGNGPWVGLA